ncbi:MAG: COP23 domain-containing protein [Phormidesmis sp.]
MVEIRKVLLGGTLCTGLIGGLIGTSLPAHAQNNDPLPEVESTTGGTQLPEEARFECQLFDGDFTVMYRPESQPQQVYPWATPSAMGGGWTAEKRCYTISERLESYRPEGLVELQVGTENGYDVVCATTEQTPGLCKIVFTVPPGQNPVVTRDQVFENLALADGGNDTTIVNTFTGNGSSDILGQISEALNLPTARSSARPSASTGINLKPFLDAADGGTGTALRAGTVSGRQLNPERFR